MTDNPIHIGIAGWTYEDWNNTVYPAGKIDQLRYISDFVDCIEINSTFYRPPFEKTTASWLRRTADKPGFFFTAKLNRDFTHEGRIDPAAVTQFHKGFAPLLEAGRLRQLLAQFRYDFADTPDTRAHIVKITAAFKDAFDVVLELRHKSWQAPATLEFLSNLGVTVCNLDYPVSSNSFDLRLCIVGTCGYFRLHGRNAAKWFSKSSRDETYNYYYNESELAQIKQRMDELARAFKNLTVIMNNHYRGAELANAIELKAMLTGQKQPIPEPLVKTYPTLRKIAANV